MVPSIMKKEKAISIKSKITNKWFTISQKKYIMKDKIKSRNQKLNPKL